MADSIVVEQRPHLKPNDIGTPSADLVSWVMGNVQRNRTQRDQAYQARWDEYYNIWRGRWSPESRTRKSERSRLVSPATQMAVDIKLADLIEAILGRENWFDIPDDLADQQKADASIARDRLIEDLYKDGIVDFLAEVLTCGCVYGQLSAKIVVDVKQEAQPMRVGQKLVRGYVERASIFPVCIEPGQLVWDMSGPTKIDDMLGVAHEYRLSLHKIRERQASGTYLEGDVGPTSDEKSTEGRSEQDNPSMQEDAAFVTEWHGFVPKRMLARQRGKGAPGVESFLEGLSNDDMVEAIVTIANESQLLRAIANPAVMDDRAIVSKQFGTVPNRFAGRGDVEKAYNAQKGLDTELRARADNLAWINNPMMAGDITRMPPKQDLNVWPGKFFATRGNPTEILSEFRFGDVNMSTFQQSQEYERMISQATGSMDSTTLRGGVRDESAMGSGIAASGMIKRSRLTMFNVESFLNTLLRRIMWRKMQFDPARYPMDFEFNVKGTIGILAREVELAHMTQMLQFVPEGSPPQLVLLKGIFDQSAAPNKAEMVAAVDQMMKPDPQAQALQQLQQQLMFAEQQAKINKLNAEAALAVSKAGGEDAGKIVKMIESQIALDDQQLERIRIQIEAAFAQVAVKQTMQEDVSLMLKAKELQIKARKPSAA